MNIGERRSRLAWTVAAAVAGMVIGVTGCRPTPTAASGGSTPPAATSTAEGGARVQGTAGSVLAARPPAGPGGACVFVKPDGAQKFGHVGWGFRIKGTDQWVYGAVENPTNKLYTPPGGYIGAWHAQGSYARMLSEMSRDALPHSRLRSSGGTPIPGKSTHPYSRYRCTPSPAGDVNAARKMIRTVEGRGFLVGLDRTSGDLTSRDCLDATYDVLHAYRARHLTYAPHLDIPNVWVETLWDWSDHTLQPH